MYQSFLGQENANIFNLTKISTILKTCKKLLWWLNNNQQCSTVQNKYFYCNKDTTIYLLQKRLLCKFIWTADAEVFLHLTKRVNEACGIQI